jgi:membrane fusion protein (multidrug efflux system)
MKKIQDRACARQGRLLFNKSDSACLRVLAQMLLLCLVVPFAGGCSGKDKAPPPAPAVETADVIKKDVPVYSEWVGTTDGLVNATIRAQVTGYLVKQHYTEGSFVRKGDVLFEIDPRPFTASLEEAQGVLGRQEARLATAKADLARVLPLAEANALSKKDRDDAVGAEQSAQADVRAARAAVDKAQVDLGFTKIISPIDGIAGIARAQIGDLVGTPQSAELTMVSTVDPIKVYISASEQEYLKFMQQLTGGEQEISLDLLLADASLYPHKGTFAFADRQVNVKTGTITVAALFPNPGNMLRPGQFARVRAALRIKKDALLVPQRAVTELQGGYQVAVVDQDAVVHIRPIKAGERSGRFWIIDDGLTAGERVVVEGVQKVKEGMQVSPKPFEPAGNNRAALSAPAAAGSPQRR